MCNTRVKQKHFFPNHLWCPSNFVSTTYCPSEPCCFDAKNVFRQSKISATKTLTDTSRTFKNITCTLLSVHNSTISAHHWQTGQPNSISTSDGDFKCLASYVACQNVWGQCTFLLYTKLARLYHNLLLRKTYNLDTLTSK